MKILRINDGAEGGSGAGEGGVFDTPSAPEGGGAPEGGAGGEEGGAGHSGNGALPPAAQPQAQSQLTADSIAEAMKRVGVGTQAPAEPTKQYSQEDFDKAFQVFNPSSDLVNQLIGGGDGAIQAMTKLRDGLVRQAVTMASYIVQDQMEKYEAKFKPQFEPIQKYVTEKQVKELYDDFYTANKDLKPYDSIVQAAVQQLKGEGANFKTKAEGFKAAADRARTILKSLPGISLDGEGAAGGQSPNPTRMPTLSKGGQGGLGKSSGGGQGAKNDPSHSIFG